MHDNQITIIESRQQAMDSNVHSLLRILALGDVCGESGVETIRRAMPLLQAEYKPDFVIINVENIGDGGRGVTSAALGAIADFDIAAFTTGNHIWDSETDLELFDTEPRLLRPSNYSSDLPGKGTLIAVSARGLRVGVINIQGLHHMAPIANPFDALEAELELLQDNCDLVVVDCHAELSEEKAALAHAFDGRIAAFWGTHTHVPSADDRILPQGTGFLSDLGLCGGVDGVIGFDSAASLDHALTHLPRRNEIIKKGRLVASGAVFEIDLASKHCERIIPIALDVTYRGNTNRG